MSEFDQFRRQLAELGSSLNDLEYSDAREKFDNLQKIFEVNLSTIPDHEQKLANREIHDLHKKIEKVGLLSVLPGLMRPAYGLMIYFLRKSPKSLLH